MCLSVASLALSHSCGMVGLSCGRAQQTLAGLNMSRDRHVRPLPLSVVVWLRQSANVSSFILAVGKQVCSQKEMLRRPIQGKVMVPTMRCQDLLKTWRETRRSFSGS